MTPRRVAIVWAVVSLLVLIFGGRAHWLAE